MQLLESFQRCPRFFHPTGLGQAGTKLAMRAKVFGSLLRDILAVFDSLVIAPGLIIGLPEADHKNDILWIMRTQAQSLIEMFHRRLELTIERKSVPEKSMRGGEIWIELECALKCVHSRRGWIEKSSKRWKYHARAVLS